MKTSWCRGCPAVSSLRHPVTLSGHFRYHPHLAGEPSGRHMSQLKLSIATTDYDHFRDFRLGFVKAEGI
jgi:hypothetical protein